MLEGSVNQISIQHEKLNLIESNLNLMKSFHYLKENIQANVDKTFK